MGIEHYIVCDTDRTAFELGKGLGYDLALSSCTPEVMFHRVVRSWLYEPAGDDMPKTHSVWAGSGYVDEPVGPELAEGDLGGYLLDVANRLHAWCVRKSWTGLRHWQDDSAEDIWMRRKTTTERDLEYCREVGMPVYTIEGSRYLEGP
jgi:hypothetical protein